MVGQAVTVLFPNTAVAAAAFPVASDQDFKPFKWAVV